MLLRRCIVIKLSCSFPYRSLDTLSGDCCTECVDLVGAFWYVTFMHLVVLISAALGLDTVQGGRVITSIFCLYNAIITLLSVCRMVD